MGLGIDTWEYPEAIAKLENAPHVYGAEKEEPMELEEETEFNETQNVEGYVDQYDDTE